MEQTPHVVIVPSPGMGHLIPLVELSKRLIHCHDFSVTFVVPAHGPLSKPQRACLDELPEKINYLLLPPVSLDDLPADTKIETRICLMVIRSLPFLRQALNSLVSTVRVVTLVADVFATETLEIAREFNLSQYIFFPSSAMLLSLVFYLPALDKAVECEYRDMTEPVQIPGCIPLQGSDLLDPVQDRKNDAYKHFLGQAKKAYRTADGILLNSFNDLERGAIKALQEPEPGKPPVYPVGPLVRMDSDSTGIDVSECLNWLNTQPAGSVMFISFGSGGTHTHAQLTELAHGLELSEQRFVWVVRSPSDGAANATYFNVHGQNDPLAFLPDGFLERIKGRGCVLPSWAPQVQILSHGSTGGFLTHCGWNSILESVMNGVPLIAWPLYAEQKMNAVMLTEDLKVALRPKADENGLIGQVEISRVVKALMEEEEGKQVRTRMRELKEAAAKVLSDDGSSTRALAELAQQWKGKIDNV